MNGARREGLTHLGSELLASGNVQIEEIIPGLLLKEEKGALNYILQRVKEKDELSAIRFETDLKNAFAEGCQEVSARSFLCLDITGNTVKTIHRAKLEGQTLGFLVKERHGDGEHGMQIERSFLTIFVVLVAVLITLVACVAFFLERFVRKPILSLEKTLQPSQGPDSQENEDPQSRVSEIQSIFEQARTLIAKYQDARTQAALGEFAGEVGHDLISPLGTLDYTIEALKGISQSDKNKLLAAADEVRQIALMLRSKQKELLEANDLDLNSLSPEPRESAELIALLDAAVKEKKKLYRGKRISFKLLKPEVEGVFSPIQRIEFKRLLSNILDNAVQAIEGKGNIQVSLLRARNSAIIQIVDEGRGIPKAVLPTLAQKGVSVGKENGTGLGLFHARKTVESWGGKLDIQSELGHGTTIAIHLPLAETGLSYLRESSETHLPVGEVL